MLTRSLPLFRPQGSTNNSLCFVGPHRKWDSLTGSYGNLVPGMGHWGPDARPGDVRARTFVTEHPHLHLNPYLLCSPFPALLSVRRPAGAGARPSR